MSNTDVQYVRDTLREVRDAGIALDPELAKRINTALTLLYRSHIQRYHRAQGCGVH